jgi:hypothetical protein
MRRTAESTNIISLVRRSMLKVQGKAFKMNNVIQMTNRIIKFQANIPRYPALEIRKGPERVSQFQPLPFLI